MKFVFTLTKFLFLAFVIWLLFPIQNAHASGIFNVTIDRTFDVSEQGQMQITEKRTIKNNTSNSFIKAGTLIDFEIFQFRIGDGIDTETLKKSVSTAKIFDESGNSVPFTKSLNGSRYTLEAKYPRNITSGQSIVFKLEYTNYELSEKVGALYDIYIYGFEENIKFQIDDVSTSYNTTLIVPSSLGEENFVTPAPTSKTQSGSKIVYKFSQESLVNQFVWLQLGKKQYYKFKITQEVKATRDKNIGFYNEYKIVIPRDIDEAKVQQKIYYSKIDPLPKYIEKDSGGNLIGVFEFPTSFDGTIVLEGYAEVDIISDVTANDVGNIADIPSSLSNDLKPADFWEVNDSEIQAKALELKGSETNVYKIIENTYKYIVDTIDYSDVKRFGLNKRQGAKKTLEGGAAVCMEYSDLFLTLSRAQGIPARAAFGYGYDSRVPSTEQEPHQWVEVFMPGINEWVSVEVTWGESGTTLIGGDMNHFYTHLASKDPEEPAMLELLSYGKDVDLDSPKFEIQVTDKRPNDEYETSETLLAKYPYNKPFIDFQGITRRVMSVVTTVVDELGPQNTVVIVGSFIGLILIIFTVNTINSYIREKKREI